MIGCSLEYDKQEESFSKYLLNPKPTLTTITSKDFLKGFKEMEVFTNHRARSFDGLVAKTSF